MKRMLEQAKHLYAIEDCTFTPISGHAGGRNRIVTVSRNGEKRYVLRISALGDRSENDYLAEAEFVRFLAEKGAPVADVIPSVQGRLVERMETDGKAVCLSLFAYAKGMLMADNGYRCREGAPLSEYFYNTGKVLAGRSKKTASRLVERPWSHLYDVGIQHLILIRSTFGKGKCDEIGEKENSHAEVFPLSHGRSSVARPKKSVQISSIPESLI